MSCNSSTASGSSIPSLTSTSTLSTTVGSSSSEEEGDTGNDTGGLFLWGTGTTIGGGSSTILGSSLLIEHWGTASISIVMCFFLFKEQERTEKRAKTRKVAKLPIERPQATFILISGKRPTPM